MTDDIIFGIDLGTTTSSAAVYYKEKINILFELPSYVAYTNTMQYVGESAKLQIDLNIGNVFYEVKRLIGRKFDEITLSQEKNLLSYKIIHNENDDILISSTFGKLFTPEEILSAILIKLKKYCVLFIKSEFNIDTQIINAVITIPAYFNDTQRSSILTIAKIAEINCIRVINEPTAAVLAFGYITKNKFDSKKVIVYDFGGGTLDISLVEITDGLYTVLGFTGNIYLGGSNFDRALMQHCIEELHKNNNGLVLSNIQLQYLRTACENAKCNLSSADNTNITVDNLSLNINITKNKFEEICQDLLQESIIPIENILNEHKLTINEIDDIILIGGMTISPSIRNIIEKNFKKPNYSINPCSAVAIGAAIQGNILTKNTDEYTDSIILLDITPLSLGIELSGGLMDIIIKKNTILPHKTTKLYTTDSDYITNIQIKVYEGERIYVKDNTLIGEFNLPVPKALKMVPEIEVTFNIDINGIISVVAKTIYPLNSNSYSNLIINNNKIKFNNIDICKLINNAKKYECIDTLKKELYNMKFKIYDICDIVLQNIFKLNNSEQVKEQINNIINKINCNDNIDELKEIYYELSYKYGGIAIKDDFDVNIDISNEKNILINKCNILIENYQKYNCNCSFITTFVNDFIIWYNVTKHFTKTDVNLKINEIEYHINLLDKVYELETTCLSIKALEINIDDKLNELINEALKTIETANIDLNIINTFIEKLNSY